MTNEQLKRCLFGTFIGPSVVGELHKCQQICPIVLFVIAINSQILFHVLVCSFGLPIRLGMVRSTEILANVEHVTQFFHKLSSELRILI